MSTTPIRTTTMEEEVARNEHATKAAAHFAKHPDISTFGSLEPGSFLALRWGLLDRGVLVVKLTDEAAVNYRDLVLQAGV